MRVGQGGRLQSSSAASRRLAGILADWQAGHLRLEQYPEAGI